MLVDESATATVKQLGDALTEMEVNGHVFGRCSLTVVLHHEDRRALDQQAAQAMKVLAAHDGAFFDETYNLLNAWLSIVPGNGAHNLRRLALLETHAADLSFLFGVDQGQAGSPLLVGAAGDVRDAAPHAVRVSPARPGRGPHARARRDRQRQELPAQLPGHERAAVRPVHHRPGPGSQLPQARGAASRRLRGARACDSATSASTRSALEPTPEHLHFLHGFVRVLLEGEDGYRLSELEDREVYEAVENLYVLDRSQRRLFTLANLLPRALDGAAAEMG